MILGALTALVINRGWDGTTRDRQNNKVVANLDSFELTGCHLQQRNSDETLDARDSVDTTWVLFTPPLGEGQTIGPLDRIQIAADAAHIHGDSSYPSTVGTFELVGNPDQLDHIDGVVHHLELIIRRVKL